MNSRKTFSNKLLHSSIAASLLLSPVYLYANDSAESAEVTQENLESITVTARRKTETLIEIPMSISNISAQEIQDRNYVDAKDLYRTLAGAAMPRDQLILRGLSGGNDAQPNTTTTFVDDVPIEFTNLSDVERVEVLRGPQGTLYGSNAIGGTVRIITKKPDLDEYELFGSLQAGKEKNVDDADYSYSLGMNIPLLPETLALRVSANSTKDNLPYVNLNTNLHSEIEDRFLRSQLLWQVNPEFAVTLGYSRIEKDTHGSSAGDTSKPGFTNKYTLINSDEAPYGYDVDVFEEDCNPTYSRPDCLKGTGPISKGGTPSRYQLWEAIDPWAEENTNLFSLNITHDNLFNVATVNYVGSYREFDTQALTDWSRLDGQDLFKTWLIDDSYYDRTTHEVRFQNINLSDPLTWTVGAYYDKKETKNNDENQYQYIEDDDAEASLAMYWWAYEEDWPDIPWWEYNNWAGSDLNTINENTYGNPQAVYNYNLIKEYSREFSLFADVAYTFDIGQYGELELSAGIRHYDIKDTIHDNVSGVFIDDADENGEWIESISNDSGEEDGNRYKYSVSWRPSDDLSVYALYSEGYRPGGNNGPLSNACAEDPNAKNYSKRYTSDSIDNYELGLKASALDSRVNFSFAAYQIDWTDIKTEIYMDTCGFPFITNAGEAKSQGFEFESTSFITPDLTFTFNTSYTHSTIEEDNDSIDAKKGDDMTMVPDWNVYTALDQGFMFKGMQAYVRADYSYYGEYKTHFNTLDEDKVPSYGYVNLSSRIELSEATKLSLHIDNVFDENALTYARSRSRDDSFTPNYVEYLPERSLTLRVDFTFY